MGLLVTAGGFIKQCTEYFGDWKRYTIGLQVKAWATSKSQSYLDAMWGLVRDNREAVMGPPDMAFLNKYSDDAARAMKRELPALPDSLPEDDPRYATVTAEEIAKWSPIEGGPGDRWLTHREAHEALEIVMEKLRRKG